MFQLSIDKNFNNISLKKPRNEVYAKNSLKKQILTLFREKLSIPKKSLEIIV